MKKAIWIVFVLITLKSKGQDTSCITKKIDQFNGSVTYNLPTESLPLDQETTFMILAGGTSNYKKSLTIFLKNKKVRSVDNNSEVIFLFQDGSTQKMLNSGKYDPSGLFMLMYFDMEVGGGKKMLKELLQKKIKAIRLDGYSNNHDIELDEANSTAFSQKLNCFYEGWKLYNKK